MIDLIAFVDAGRGRGDFSTSEGGRRHYGDCEGGKDVISLSLCRLSVNVEGALVLNPTFAFDTCETLIKTLGRGSVKFWVCE